MLRWFSLALILFAIVILTLQLIRFSRIWANFPGTLTIAGVPIGGMNRQQAAQRLLEVYTTPIVLRYNDAVIHLSPNTIGFELNIEAMLAAADIERIKKPFWDALWDYLWDRPSDAVNIPLSASYSEERLRAYLESEIAPRYDQPATAARPIPGTVNFQPGQEGAALDIDRSILLIENSLRSISNRSVTLPLARTSPDRPTLLNLEILLRQTIDLSGFDGVIGLYLLDLQNGQDIYLLRQDDTDITTPPDIVFTASSTIKIPIMVSIFRRLGEDIDENVMMNLERMIAQSENQASDWLMQNVLNVVDGPLIVSEDMKILGLENTFLAGYFFTGAPLLEIFETPANQRTDVNTEPDPYNQTTPLEIGLLLQDIYHCAQNGQGSLIASFPGEITQAECQMMIDNLVKDRLAFLIQAGVPDGTSVGHKHGWVTDIFGIIHDMSDAAIVFTPGGDYVLTIFLYHPIQIVFDPGNELFKNLARAVYNFYNLPER
jgi:beta-lactamase class A